MSENGRRFLTVEEAMGLLADGDDVHCFIGGGIALVGADWAREDVAEEFKKHQPQLLGPTARSLKHGVGYVGDIGLFAFATDPTRLAALDTP